MLVQNKLQVLELSAKLIMNIHKYSAMKRNATESQNSQSTQARACPIAKANCAASSRRVSGDGSSAGGAGAGVGEGEEEEEPSSSSSRGPRNWLAKPNEILNSIPQPQRPPADSPAAEETHSDSSDLDRTVYRDLSIPQKSECVEQGQRMKGYCRVTKAQLKEAAKIAAEKGGECISKVIITSDEQLTFKCRHNHLFKSTCAVASHDWCPTCAKYWEQCKEFARTNGGKIISEVICKPLEFECSQGHRFSCKTYKKKHLRWCQLCAAKSEEEKHLEQEKLRLKEKSEKQNEQESLFEAARREVEAENRNHTYQKLLHYEQRLEVAARMFAQKESTLHHLNRTESYCINRILLASSQFLFAQLQLL